MSSEGLSSEHEQYANWKAPETTLPTEQNTAEKVLRVGDKEFRIGDSVTVFRTSGSRETDWTLQSFGKEKAVVVRPNPQGGMDREVPTIAQFLQWQAMSPSGKINVSELPPEARGNIPSEEEIRRLTGL